MSFEELFSKMSPVKSSEIEPSFMLMCEIMYETGVRAAELRRVQVKDFDFSNRGIVLRDQYDASKDLHFRKICIGSSGREIFIPFSLADRLNEYIWTLRAPDWASVRDIYIFSKHLRKNIRAQKSFVLNRSRTMYLRRKSLVNNLETFQLLSEEDKGFRNFLLKALFNEC